MDPRDYPTAASRLKGHGVGKRRHQQVVNFLSALQNSHEHMRGVFRHGGCYELHRILKTLEPSASAWYIDGHVYTAIENVMYDIDGPWLPSDSERTRLVPLSMKRHKPSRWRNRAAERRRGFQERQLGFVQVGWWLRGRLALSRLKIRILRATLPARKRRRVLHAITLRAEAEAIAVQNGAGRAMPHGTGVDGRRRERQGSRTTN